MRRIAEPVVLHLDRESARAEARAWADEAIEAYKDARDAGEPEPESSPRVRES